MPMKWTPENNEILLYKILETSSVTADVKAISASWPTNNGEIPTPRAITERLCKIRSNVKASGGSHFSVKAARSKLDATNPNTGNPRTPSSTPRKPRAKKGDALSNPGSGKRKRNDEVEVKLEGVVKEEGFMDGNSNLSGLYEDEAEMVSPSKKMKLQYQVPRNVTCENGEESEGEAETDETPFPEEECV